MTKQIPPVDNRIFDNIVEDVIELAGVYCPQWQPAKIENRENKDPATALVYLFAHLMEIVITRLNRLPEKYFLAFLDYIGAQLRPPTPAAALLRFTLSDGADRDQWVPVGSQTASEETRLLEEQVFETLGHLVVTPVKLVTKTPSAQGEPDAFYLGFDAPFSNDSHSIFFLVDENQGDTRSLQWEYSSGEGQWTRLTVKDSTRNLSSAGHVHFIGPEDFSQTQAFGQALYWLRVRLTGENPSFSHHIRETWLNTVWAENAETVNDELLGSSDGSGKQQFQFNRSPVLPGQQVRVNEREIPADEDLHKILEEEGEDAVVIERDEQGTVTKIRVRWHEVDNFYASGPRDRHYVMEPSSGILYFGDGSRGMIPPIGTDNIYCSSYRTGGGARGNVGEGKVTQLKVSLPYIDSVSNMLPAGGGMDAETPDELKERGPFMLKHRDRAVTAEDFEWIMREAPGDIAVSKCIPAKEPESASHDTLVTVVIVPDTGETKPYPSKTMLKKVEEYLYRRCFGTLAQAPDTKAKVTGPGYIEVSVDAQIVPQPGQPAGKVEERAMAALARFFHPLRGGAENNGWPFGRDVHRSEVMTVLQNTAGVDFVNSLSLTAHIQIYRIRLTQPVPFYFPPGSAVSSADGAVRYQLAEEIEQTGELIVKGFKEDDIVTVTAQDNPADILFDELRLTSVSRDHLTFSLDATHVIPPGSVITTKDGTVTSIITELTGARSVKVKELAVGQPVTISSETYSRYTFDGYVDSVDTENPTRIYLEPHYLVYGGAHSVEMVIDEKE
jgi:hypothetical protein